MLLSIPITSSLRYEKVLKILATGPAVVHPYSFWMMGSSQGALSLLTRALNFAFLVLVAALTLIDGAASTSLFFIDLPVEGTLRTVTEFVHGIHSVVDSCSLPPPPAEQIPSESPQSIPFGGLGLLAPPHHFPGEVTDS